MRNTRAQLRDSSSIKISIQSEQYVNYQEKSHSQNVATTVMGITGGASLLTGMGFTLPQFSHGFERDISSRLWFDARDFNCDRRALCIGSVILAIAGKKK